VVEHEIVVRIVLLTGSPATDLPCDTARKPGGVPIVERAKRNKRVEHGASIRT